LTEVVEKGLKKIGITVSKPILVILCIIFGIIIVKPDLLGIIVGIFFIIEGILLLTDYLELQRQQKPQPPPA
jgi:hypothetical protein